MADRKDREKEATEEREIYPANYSPSDPPNKQASPTKNK